MCTCAAEGGEVKEEESVEGGKRYAEGLDGGMVVPRVVGAGG